MFRMLLEVVELCLLIAVLHCPSRQVFADQFVFFDYYNVRAS